jgi:hypothetical protein
MYTYVRSQQEQAKFNLIAFLLTFYNIKQLNHLTTS